MNKNLYKMLFNVSEIDINYHSLIEASAGTGKTYTIENLVLRFLIEEDNIDLKNVLIVTFTEKATNELKQRIEKRLANLLNFKFLPIISKKKIHKILDSFSEAQIFTIHAFCNSVLKNCAFDAGLLFNRTIVDDKFVLEKVFRQQILSFWPIFYGNKFKIISALLDFGMIKDNFFLKKINSSYLDSTFYNQKKLMFYSYKKTNIEQLWLYALVILKDLENILGFKDNFLKQFLKLNIDKRVKKKLIQEILIPIDKILTFFFLKKPNFILILSEIKRYKKKIANSIKNRLLYPKKWLKLGKNLQECPNILIIESKLVELIEIFLIILNSFSELLLENILIEAKIFKRRNGLISYIDMLEWLEVFLKNEGFYLGIEKLRKKYKIAFVDEFQDTDLLQWRIFKKIFIEGFNNFKCKKNKLFLIGDPKQAIYSFRGADVMTYYKAKIEMEKLAFIGSAKLYSLGNNWRAMPELQSSLNDIFSSQYWFNNYDYQKINSPGLNKLSKILLDNRNKKKHFLNIINFSTISSLKKAKHLFAKYISEEIDKIVKNPKLILLEKNKGTRVLEYGDICILLRGKPDLEVIQSVLSTKNIPYFYYGERKNFQSIEANFLSQIFHAVLEPSNLFFFKKILFTPLFNIPFNKIFQLLTPSSEYYSFKLLKKWNKYSKQGNWTKLFKSIIVDSKFILGSSFDSDWNKVNSNFIQIFTFLEKIAIENNFDFNQIVVFFDEHMDSYYKDMDYNDTKTTQLSVTKESQVKIMSIHASKGLEFPVVFIAGGLSSYRDDSYLFLPKNKNISFTKTMEEMVKGIGIKKYLKSKDVEEKRIFYVALTRACLKLYIPYYPVEKKSLWIGPISSFISDSIDDVFGNTILINSKSIWHTPQFVEDKKKITNKNFEKSCFKTSFYKVTIDSFYSNPKFNKFKKVKTRILDLDSFSKIINLFGKRKKRNNLHKIESDFLLHSHNSMKSLFCFDNHKEFKKKEEVFPPSNKKIGSMLHSILEKISFKRILRNPDQILSNKESRVVIERFMYEYEVDQFWLKSISRIVANILTSSMKIDGTKVFLGEIPKNSRQHEVEFYCSIDSKQIRFLSMKDYFLKEKIPDKIFLHGYIDMLFSFNDKIYIVDWKSNSLGMLYDNLSLKKNIFTLGYDLQYKLYALAVVKWLRYVLMDDSDIFKHFGGVFYLYLRGMDFKNNSGIYYVPYENFNDFNFLEREILEFILISRIL